MWFFALGAFAAPLQLNWDTPVRYLVEHEVQLPSYIWLVTSNNLQGRVMAYDLKMVLDCEAAVAPSKRSRERSCLVEEVSLNAAMMPGDQGHSAALLEMMDDRLTGAHLNLFYKADGRLKTLTLDGPSGRTREENSNNEQLRMLIRSALSGLSLDTRTTTSEEMVVWSATNDPAFEIPNMENNHLFGDVLFRIDEVEDGVANIQFVGEGAVMVSPINRYRSSLHGWARFDLNEGVLLSRQWVVEGKPTPSSFFALGAKGVSHEAWGRVTLLSPGQEVQLGESAEIVNWHGLSETAITRGTPWAETWMNVY